MKINVHTVPHLTHVASALFSYEILSQVSTQIELVAPNKEEMYPFSRARNNVLNVPDHGDRQSRLFSDQIKIWSIRSIFV
jgi:hypothetical protein